MPCSLGAYRNFRSLDTANLFFPHVPREREAVALDSMRTEWGNRSVYRIDVGYRFSRGRLPFCISSEDEVLGLPLQTYKHGMLSRHVLNWPQVGKCFNALT